MTRPGQDIVKWECQSVHLASGLKMHAIQACVKPNRKVKRKIHSYFGTSSFESRCLLTIY